MNVFPVPSIDFLSGFMSFKTNWTEINKADGLAEYHEKEFDLSCHVLFALLFLW